MSWRSLVPTRLARGVAIALLAWSAACDRGVAPVAAEPEGPVEVETWLEQVSDNGGVLVVQTVFDPAGEVRLPEPPEGRLRFEPVGEPVAEPIGDRQVLTQKYKFVGQGSHEIPALEASWQGPNQAEPVTDASSPLFVDLGVAPPREGELADIVEPRRVWTPPWGAIAAVGGVGGVMAAGLWMALRGARARPAVAARIEPPDIAVLRRWEAVRADPALGDEEKATALSLLFREYTEAVLGFAATAWTTTEIVRHLEGMRHLPQGNVPRARRLLRATDRVKYADARATAELFDELDADLRAFVGSTRPQRWEERPPEGTA